MAGSTQRPAEPVRRAAVVTHGRRETIGPALARLEALAREAGVELLIPREEFEKHGLAGTPADPETADIVVVLGDFVVVLDGVVDVVNRLG